MKTNFSGVRTSVQFER